MKKGNSAYRLFGNMKYAFSLLMQDSPADTLCMLLTPLTQVAAPYLAMMLPKVVLDALEHAHTPAEFIIPVALASAALTLATLANGYTLNLTLHHIGLYKTLTLKRYAKLMEMDYEQMEDPDVLRLMAEARQELQGGVASPALALRFPTLLTQLVAGLLGFLVYGGVITQLHPLVLALMLFSAVINAFALAWVQRFEQGFYSRHAYTNQKLWNLLTWMQEKGYAKDIRLYSLTGWLDAMIRSVMKHSYRECKSLGNRQMCAQLINALLILLRDGLAYLYLIQQLLAGQLSLGDFVLIFAAINGFASWISLILENGSLLLRSSWSLSKVRAFLDLPSRRYSTGVRPSLSQCSPPEIRFEDVSYRYPGADKPALEHISFTLHPGEKIALVGMNGAGKTTLVKLLCGLYTPTSGTIYLNGQDLQSLEPESYIALLAPVFQDIHILPASIAVNVSQAAPEKIDRAKVIRCIQQVGLQDVVDRLPKGIDTPLVASLTPGAVDFSGGELQKLAMARALYRDSPILILDEPTAALDPLAEQETYRQYHRLAEHKTSLYISHRLASTRFCDRILLLEKGRLAQTGDHDTLLKADGPYASMYQLQSSYYQTQTTEAE